MSIHHGISCDFCRKKNFSFRRYKCLICNDFDLCGNCYEKNFSPTISTHSNEHPMQLIITANDYEQIYFGNKSREYSSGSYVCPLCKRNGFSLDILVEHFEEQHLRNHSAVLCPICFTRSTRLFEHLYQHTEENFPTKIKKILLPIEQSLEHGLLTNFLPKHSNRYDHDDERYLFLQALLTDMIQRDSSVNSST